MPWLANVSIANETWCGEQESRGQQGGEVEEVEVEEVGDGIAGGGLGEEEQETEHTFSLGTLYWRCWPGWLRCLVPVAAVWSVVHQEAPFHPSVGLVEATGRLWLAGVLWTSLGLAAALSCLLLSRVASLCRKEMVSQNKAETVREAGQTQHECHSSLIGRREGSRLGAVARALLEGLAVSVLQEPLSEPSLAQLRGLIARLEAVSQAVSEGGLPDWRPLQASEEEEEEEEDTISEEESLLVARARHVCTYLQDRVGTLRSLLQVQAEYCVCVADVQQDVQGHWEQLETLHSNVTLQPRASGDPGDPHDPCTVLTCTQSLYTQLSVFRSRIQDSEKHLSTIIGLLQDLKEMQESLAGTVGLTLDSVWIKHFLQSNTEQFEKVYTDFSCLEQQMQTFVVHLKDLQTSEQAGAVPSEPRHPGTTPPSPVSSVPVYRTTGLEPGPHPNPLPKTHHALSAMDYLCGLRRRR